jgi:uncharacterized protein involved in exopolysaccharide biosynthesis
MKDNNSTDDEISVRELVRILWSGRYVVLGMTVVLTVIAFAYSLLATKKYDATTIVSPVADESSGGGRLSSLVSQVSGLSSLTSMAGLSSNTSTQKAETVAVLQSNSLTQSYVLANQLLPTLFPGQWDSVQHKWKVQGKDIPTVWKANVLFRKKIRSVATDSKTGLVGMTISWRDPQLAAKWANDLVKLTNDFLQKKAIDEAERNIVYLSEQAAKTDVVGVRQAIYEIMQEEIKKMMLARGSNEFALKVIDPAVAPEKPSSPEPVVWTIMAFFGGLFLSLMVVLVRHWWRTA